MSLSPIEAPDFSSYQYLAEFEDLNFRDLSFWAIVDTPPSKSFSRKSHRPLLVAECVDMRQWLLKPAGVLRESPANRFRDRGCVDRELQKRGDLAYRCWFTERIPLSVKTQKTETALTLFI